MSKTVPEILESAAATYRERNLIYKDNFKKVGAILAILHGPHSAHPLSSFAEDAETQTLFDLYRMIIGKLTRFAESGLTHVDSIHDACVYCAMVESLLPVGEVLEVRSPLPRFNDSVLGELGDAEVIFREPPTDAELRGIGR